MSRTTDFFEEASSLFWLLFFGSAIAYGLFSVCNDWSLNTLIKDKEKETWIIAERSQGSYSAMLDEEWAASIFNSINARIKYRATVASDSNNNLDLAYEVMARLTRPKLPTQKLETQVDYSVDLAIEFIDEDGFVIHKLTIPRKISHYDHEKHKFAELKRDWNDHEVKNIHIKSLLSKEIHSNVAKKVKRIIWKPRIYATKKKEEELTTEETSDFSLYEIPYEKKHLKNLFYQLAEERQVSEDWP